MHIWAAATAANLRILLIEDWEDEEREQNAEASDHHHGQEIAMASENCQPQLQSR